MITLSLHLEDIAGDQDQMSQPEPGRGLKASESKTAIYSHGPLQSPSSVGALARRLKITANGGA